VAIVTSTSTHKQVVMDARLAGRHSFARSPCRCRWRTAYEMLAAVEKAGVFFHMAFQRRFDAGYLAAKKKGTTGSSGSRGDDLPSRATRSVRRSFAIRRSAAPDCDMGVTISTWTHVHGEVRDRSTPGGALAYPEMKSVGEYRHALVTWCSRTDPWPSVQLSRNAVFGYDIRTEIWGTKALPAIGVFPGHADSGDDAVRALRTT